MNIKIQKIHYGRGVRRPGFPSFSLKRTVLMLFLVVLSGIQTVYPAERDPSISATTQADSSADRSETGSESVCSLPPIDVPAFPDWIPGYTQLDPKTQLHVTGIVPKIDFSSYRLEISGEVEETIYLKYDDLRCMNRIKVRARLICPGYFEDVATWTGTPLGQVLALAELKKGASRIQLVGADGHKASVPLEEALKETNFLAYKLEGNPIPVLHGFPIRAVFPNLQGNEWVKWLIRIEVK